MLEVVFSQCVEGAMKVAQQYGIGSYIGGAISVIYQYDDGAEPSEEELEQMRQQAQERERRNWENAVPLGGEARDIFCFSCGYSMGDITGDGLSQQRVDSITELYSIFPNGLPYCLKALEKARSALDTLVERASAGEEMRIWYSDEPDECCGIYWLMCQLCQRMENLPRMWMVKLPDFTQVDSEVRQNQGWGDVDPGEYGRYAARAEAVIPALVKCMVEKWQQLQTDNAMLRAVINGQLQSVPENFYDAFIEKELAKMGDTFPESKLVIAVLNDRLGIGDFWITQRIEKIIDEGRLVPITQPKPGEELYRRTLKKV